MALDRRISIALLTIVPCFFAQNAAFGLAVGSYGPLLAANQVHFGVSRAAVSLGPALFNLGIGLAAPIIGMLLQRVAARMMMMVAALTMGACYACIAFTSSFSVALSCYALVGGSAGALGVLGPVTIVNRWFVTSRAKVLGFINLPVFLLIVPPVVGTVLPRFGRVDALLFVAASYVLLTPMFAMLKERPPGAALEQQPGAAARTETQASPGASRILRSPAFWLLSIGIGLLAGASSAFVTHIVPFGTTRGLELGSAAGLISVFAACGLVGSMGMGWAADRVGAYGAMILGALVQAIGWLALQFCFGLPLFVLSGLMGLVLVPVVTLHQAGMSEIMPAPGVAKAMGMSYLIKLPFIFVMPMLGGLLYDLSRSYWLAFLVFGSLALVSAMIFLLLRLTQQRLVNSTQSPASL